MKDNYGESHEIYWKESKVGKPTMGQTTNYGKQTSLDANSPIAGGSAHYGGDFIPSTNSNVSVSGPTGLVETTASTENLSKKFKYPQVSQDTVPQDLTAKAGSSI